MTAAERVLLHLLPLWNVREPAREATQEGISDGTRLLRSHVPRALKRLVEEGHVDVREGRLRGRGRKVRLYTLTEPGIRRAKEIVAGLQDEEVVFGDRRVKIGALSTELRLPPSEIVAGLDDGGRFIPRQVALAVPERELLGRDDELRTLAGWLRGPEPVLAVYGSRGIGKTALAQAFARQVRRPIAWVEVRGEEPQALTRDLAASLARAGGKGRPEEVAGDLAALRPLVVVDGYGEVPEPIVDGVASLVASIVASPGAKLLVLAQEGTPAYCRFYGPADVRKGSVKELRLKGLDPDATRRLLRNPGITEEGLRQVYLLTKGCPLYLVLIRDRDAARLREVSRFTPAEVRLLLFSGSPRV